MITQKACKTHEILFYIILSKREWKWIFHQPLRKKKKQSSDFILVSQNFMVMFHPSFTDNAEMVIIEVRNNYLLFYDKISIHIAKKERRRTNTLLCKILPFSHMERQHWIFFRAANHRFHLFLLTLFAKATLTDTKKKLTIVFIHFNNILLGFLKISH